jgi:lysozyme
MKTSLTGRKLIEQFEGLILQAYDDYNDHVVKQGDTVHGTLTIGYGHTTSAGPPAVYIGQQIDKTTADQILAQDLSVVEKEVNTLIKVPLNQNQFDALVSFHFNTGALGRSSILKLLNAKNYLAAADALLLYNKAGGRVLAGLVRRRQAEKALFLTPALLVAPAATAATVGTVVVAGAVATGVYPHLWIVIPAAVVVILIGMGVVYYFKHKGVTK